MAARLTDKQKKRIIADYVELGSYNAVAKKHGVSHHTVKAVVTAGEQTAKKCQRKKDKNTLDMLAYMESRKKKTQDTLDILLEAMSDPAKLAKASLVQLGTVYGILVDKATGTTGLTTEEQRARLENLKANTAKLKGEDSEADREDDGFMDALKAEVADTWQE